MRRRSVLWALTVVALAGLSPALAAQDSRPGIAVMPFTNGGSYGKDKEDFQALEKGLALAVTDNVQSYRRMLTKKSA